MSARVVPCDDCLPGVERCAKHAGARVCPGCGRVSCRVDCPRNFLADVPVPFKVRELGPFAGSVQGPNDYRQADLTKVGARPALVAQVLAALDRWVALRDGARGTGRDAWDGRGHSPRELGAAEAALEAAAKRLREGR